MARRSDGHLLEAGRTVLTLSSFPGVTLQPEKITCMLSFLFSELLS